MQAEEKAAADAKVFAEKNMLITELEGRIQRRDDSQYDLENRLRQIYEERQGISKEEKELQDQITVLTKGIENFEALKVHTEAERAGFIKGYEQEKRKANDLIKNMKILAERCQAELEEVRLDIEKRRNAAVDATEARINEKQEQIDGFRREIEKNQKLKQEMENRVKEVEQEFARERDRAKKTQQTYQLRFEAMTKLLGTFSFREDALPIDALLCD
jgi:chromosome segregation ATPase